MNTPTPTEIDLATLSDEEIKSRFDEGIRVQAQQETDKILKKNRHELRRLKKQYEEALLTGNKDMFKYTLSKLRAIYKQQVSEDILDLCWRTSRETIQGIIDDHQGTVQETEN